MLPPKFQDWFAARGWQPRAHQLALAEHAAREQSVLLVAPTGGGKSLAAAHRRVGLSATVKDPAPLQRFLMPQPIGKQLLSEIVIAQGGAKPKIEISASDSYVPWAGHLARHAMVDVMAAIQTAKTALGFVNTRSQAERTFL